MEENKVKLTIRQNSGSQFEVEVNPKQTVKELKEACVEKAGIPADEQRLIFKGMYTHILRIFLIKLHCRKDLEG